jgi:hypothetical protein
MEAENHVGQELDQNNKYHDLNMLCDNLGFQDKKSDKKGDK